jgi:hypothetical protein
MINYIDAVQLSRAKYAELIAQAPQHEGYTVEMPNLWHQAVAALKTVFARKSEAVAPKVSTNAVTRVALHR